MGISSVYPEDSGIYTCVATNRVGQDQTHASLVCEGKEGLLLNTQHANALGPIGQLDSYQVHIGPVLEDRPEEIYSLQQPRFIMHPQPQISVSQDDRVHIECKVHPANDPKLKVEW